MLRSWWVDGPIYYEQSTILDKLDPSARDIRSWERPPRLALVLGNEATGLSAPWLEACSDRITLPMLGGADSLNLATAAAVFLYALALK